MHSHVEESSQQQSMNDEDEACQRLDRICECAHKILTKYTSNGMIKMSDGPQFHDLVENWDYRMICILEVYTQNRNEDDFLENLGILGELIREQGEQNEFDSDINRTESQFSQNIQNDFLPASYIREKLRDIKVVPEPQIVSS